MTEESTVGAEAIGFTPLGEIFANARNVKNLALKDVSNNLRLSIKQIEALESDDFASLPPAMITRGFIRNYARLLELDAEPLLASYRARVPDALPAALSIKTSMNQVMSSNGSPSFVKYFVIAGLIVLSLAAGFYYTNFIQKPANISDESSTGDLENQATAEALPLPEVALPAAERQLPTEASSIEVPVATSADTAVEQALPQEKLEPEVANKAEVAEVAQASKKLEQTSVLRANSPTAVMQEIALPKEKTVDFKTLKERAASNQLLTNSSKVNETATEAAKIGLKTDSTIAAIKGVNLAVTEETWVRVTDKSGAVVYEKLLQANSEDGFNGLPPFKLLIGNAKATKLSFLGHDVDLTDKTKNNVARVTLE